MYFVLHYVQSVCDISQVSQIAKSPVIFNQRCSTIKAGYLSKVCYSTKCNVYALDGEFATFGMLMTETYELSVAVL